MKQLGGSVGWLAALALTSGPGVAREAILYDCPPGDPGVRYVVFGPEARLSGAVMGAGETGVVLSNQSDNEACRWVDFARALVGAGYRVLLYGYATPRREEDTAAAVGAMRQLGARRVILVGFSQGAKTSLMVAARGLPGVAAVVSLSADEFMAGLDIKPYAGRVRVPVLFVTSSTDAFGANRATPLFYRLAPAADKQLVVMPGSAHGHQLLRDPRVVRRVLDFIAAHR